MAKRFIETDIWKKSWWRKLPPKIKLFYIYMICNCDHAGIWSDVDLELAEFHIGRPIDKKDILDKLGEHIEVLKEDKWFVKKFPSFQYGILNPNVKAHASVIKILEKNKCLETVSNSYVSGQDKDKSKSKVKEKDMDSKILERKISVVNSMVNRANTFRNDVNGQYADKYDKELRIDFCDYWTEGGGTKLRFEREKVFDIGRRLARWKKNDFNKKDESVNFRLDSTGNSWIAYCTKCRISDFFKKEELKGGSRCCKAKLVPYKEDK